MPLLLGFWLYGRRCRILDLQPVRRSACRERLGKVTEVHAKLLKSYVKKFGWPSDPLIFHEDGGIYAYGSKV